MNYCAVFKKSVFQGGWKRAGWIPEPKNLFEKKTGLCVAFYGRKKYEIYIPPPDFRDP